MSSIVIAGDTSGSVTLQAPAVAGSTVLNLPSTSGTIQTSGAGYTTNGVAYASSTTGLTTGSALTYNGTNLTLGSGYFEITGSNSLYLGSGMLSSSSGAFPLILGFNGVEKMRIGTSTIYTASGVDVGIGTNSPSAVLNAYGATSYAGLNVQAVLSDSTALAAGTGGILAFEGKYSGASLANFGAIGGLKENATSGNYAGYLGFYTRANGSLPAEKMRLDSSGNLGLGVTPSAWGAYRAFQFGQQGVIFGDAGGGTSALGSNQYWNGSNWIRIAADAASQYKQAGGSHAWYYAASSTAGSTISFTQAMTLDASGNLVIGATSTSQKLRVYDSGSNTVIRAENGTSAFEIQSNSNDGYINMNGTGNIIFRSGSGFTERARIDSSGNFLVNTTSATSGGSSCKQVVYISNFATTYGISVQGGTNNGGTFFQTVNYAGTQNGSITQVNSGTIAYNTTSDYRLKENIAPMTGALAKVAQLKPVTYTWKLDGASGEGFIAHELKDIIPDAVTGEKDAVNEDGSIKPQSIDTSFLVATLTAALQEAHGLIKDLETRISVLENK